MEDGFKVYVIDYEYDDSRWSIKVPATSKADVVARLKAIERTATVFGYHARQVQSSSDVPAFAT